MRSVYVHNILRNTFTTKFMWKVVTSSNLNPPLKLFFYSPILTNNNLLLKIYCENIVVVFPFFHSYVSFFFLFFFSCFFSVPHTYTHISHPLLFFFFFPPLSTSKTSLSISFSHRYCSTTHIRLYFFS